MMLNDTGINKTASLVVLLLGTSMAAIDSSIVNVSLPVIRSQFGSNISEVQWVVTAYMLSFSVFIPLTDWLSHRIGYFNLYVVSTAIFTLGSLLCGFSTSLNSLVASRVLQAIGSGAITPAALAIITTVFPKKELGKAMGIWGLGTVMGPALGPTLGGVLTQHFGWPYIFFVNVPLGIITIMLSFRYLRFLKKDLQRRLRFNVSGFVSLALFLVSLQYLFTNINRLSFPGFGIPAVLIIVIGSFLAFYFSSTRSSNPLLDLSLFKRFQFVNALGLVAIRSLALYSILFLLPFLLQGALGYSETESGLLILPNAVVLGIFIPFSGRWAENHGFRVIVIIGLIFLSASTFIFGRIDVGSPVIMIIIGMVLRGVGFGVMNTPLTESVISSVPKENVAMASSINTLTIQVSGALGVSATSLLHNFMEREYLAKGLAPAIAEHQSLLNSFLLSAILILFAIIPALKLPGRIKRPGTNTIAPTEIH